MLKYFIEKLFHWVRCHLRLQLRINFMNTSYKIALVRMPQNFFDDKLTLVQVMPWYCQATSHYLIQCLPKSMSKYGITRPQWFISLKTLHTSSSQVRSRAIVNIMKKIDHVLIVYWWLYLLFHRLLCLHLWWGTTVRSQHVGHGPVAVSLPQTEMDHCWQVGDGGFIARLLQFRW